jgi:hypothetical protein
VQVEQRARERDDEFIAPRSFNDAGRCSDCSRIKNSQDRQAAIALIDESGFLLNRSVVEPAHCKTRRPSTPGTVQRSVFTVLCRFRVYRIMPRPNKTGRLTRQGGVSG